MTQGNQKVKVDVVDWSWDDWIYPKKKGNTKQQMKKSIQRHFILFNNIHLKNLIVSVDDNLKIKDIKDIHSYEFLPKRW